MEDYKELADDVRDRINATLKDKGITQNQVAAGDTPAQKRINSQLSHGSNITLDTVLRILDACPDISADWLLRGSGDMYVTAGTSVTGANNVTGRSATVIGQQVGTLTEDFVRDLIAEKDKQIRMLIEKIGK